MHHLTNRDIWFTTPPDEADNAAWDAYADRYHDRAERIVADFLTDTVATTDINRTDREILIAALTRVVHGQDTEMVTAWARELSDEIPSFEQWYADQRERAA